MVASVGRMESWDGERLGGSMGRCWGDLWGDGEMGWGEVGEIHGEDGEMGWGQVGGIHGEMFGWKRLGVSMGRWRVGMGRG